MNETGKRCRDMATPKFVKFSGEWKGLNTKKKSRVWKELQTEKLPRNYGKSMAMTLGFAELHFFNWDSIAYEWRQLPDLS